jgi:hypothetical protein
MNIVNRPLLSAMLLTGIFSAAAATAATPTTAPMKPAMPAATHVASAGRCNELLTQFDSAKASHGNAKEYGRAIEERNNGESACKAGDFKKADQQLASALRDIGVKPVANKS